MLELTELPLVATSPLLAGKGTLARLNATATETKTREQKMADAIRTILECIGEDPDRQGLRKTPERYAKALLWMTKGYEEKLSGRYILAFMRVSPRQVRSSIGVHRGHWRSCLCRGSRRDGHSP